jgi:hypothetical protein
MTKAAAAAIRASRSTGGKNEASESSFTDSSGVVAIAWSFSGASSAAAASPDAMIRPTTVT